MPVTSDTISKNYRMNIYPSCCPAIICKTLTLGDMGKKNSEKLFHEKSVTYSRGTVDKDTDDHYLKMQSKGFCLEMED